MLQVLPPSRTASRTPTQSAHKVSSGEHPGTRRPSHSPFAAPISGSYDGMIVGAAARFAGWPTTWRRWCHSRSAVPCIYLFFKFDGNNCNLLTLSNVCNVGDTMLGTKRASQYCPYLFKRFLDTNQCSDKSQVAACRLRFPHLRGGV